MPKKTTKKQTKKVVKKQVTKIKKSNKKSRLDPGKKLCKSCGNMIAIHKKVCGECGHVHQMRKKKQDVLKNLSKVTPIIIKSVIQNNDFNLFRGWNQNALFKIGNLMGQKGQGQLKRTASEQSGEAVPRQTGRRRSQPPKSDNIGQSISFKELNRPEFFSLNLSNPISSICTSQNWIVFSETISKAPIGLSQKQLLTIEAYQLQRFHLVEVDYTGISYIHFAYNSRNMSNIHQFKFNKVLISYCVLSMKVFCNLVTILTGKSSLLIFSLPNHNALASNSFTLSSPLELVEPSHDKITSFEYLRSTVCKDKDSSILLAAGTLQGHISVYKISSQGYKLVKYIPNAHNEMVTVISECPLNRNQQSKEQEQQNQQQTTQIGTLFASGCYDGTVSIWEMVEKKPIFSCQCSNRKIWSLYWDPGAKFLFVNREQLNDTCIILCFYSINKIENTIHLSNTIQTRSIKTYLNSTMCHNDCYSKYLPILDSVGGIFRVFQIEELRGNSLKKKKSKKQDNSELFYQIKFKRDIENGNSRANGKNESKGSVQIEQFILDTQDDEQRRKIMRTQTQEIKRFPIFSGISIQNKQNCDIIYFSSYNGSIVAYIHGLK